MKGILLAWSSGMCRSLVVRKMKGDGECIGEEGEIWGVGEEEGKKEMGDGDVVLIGREMRFLKGDVEKEGEKYGI
ncbi:PTS sugar transporter subunit IIB, partial [Bacillus altitudinis]|uniref:PTS sugar transporter subunit IIB n=1 Tax=Bacillus altitudinis TaxID=293387 RepID=UPI0011A19788